ncbi:Endonuclease/exonuclease/phosphatase domain-containing protein 1 [Sparganum proliferum]
MLFFQCCQSEAKENLLTFFNNADERDLIQRYPFLAKSLASTLISQRASVPFRRLGDISRVRILQSVLTNDLSNPDPDSLGLVTVITECNPSQPIPSPPYQPPHRPLRQEPTPPPNSTTAYANDLLHLLAQTELLKAWNAFCSQPLQRPGDIRPPHKFRLATWNLDRFSLTKACHPGFRECVCLTIVKNDIDIIAFQEMSGADAVDRLTSELNSPTLPNVRRWFEMQDPRYKPQWSAVTSKEPTGLTFQGKEYSAFLYRSDRVQLTSCGILGRVSAEQGAPTSCGDKTFARDPFMGKFKLGSQPLVLASVHLKAAGLRDSQVGRTTSEVFHLSTFVDAFNESLPERSQYVILGDFNLDPDNEAFDVLRDRGLRNVLPSGCPTMVAAAERSSFELSSSDPGRRRAVSSTASCFDNAWISPSLQQQNPPNQQLCYSENSGVINSDLRHPLIINVDRVTFNGFSSDHCPVYFDLHVTSGPL